MKYLLSLLLLLSTAIMLFSRDNSVNKNDLTKVCLSAEEMKLYKMIMEYRDDNDLPPIPLSRSLSYVAQQHCLDLYSHKSGYDDECNTHSWSGDGDWTPCCYTADHKQAKCMWNKPAELTGYRGTGYEIASEYSDPDYETKAEAALKAWKKSKFHNQVIVNEASWKNYNWKAIGIGIYKGYAVVWFGTDTDNEKEPARCR